MKLTKTMESDDIRIINGEVFTKINGTQTAKIGFEWFSNGKSRFVPGYKSIELPDKLKTTQTEIH